MAAPEITKIQKIKTSAGNHEINAKYWNGQTGIKTFGGKSLFGSGNIPCAYPILNHDTSNTTISELTPNVFHIWGTVTSLNITLGEKTTDGFINEYIFQFTSGTTATTLTLPTEIKWANGVAPNIIAGATYQISIVNELGTILSFQ